MSKTKLAFKLIDMGLNAETLSNLTESQLRLLYKKLNESKKENKEDVSVTQGAPTINVKGKGSVDVNGQVIKLDGSMNLPGGPNTKVQPLRGETTEGKNRRSKKYNPWAICTASVGRKNKKKYERCVMDVKKSIKEGKDPIDLFLEENIVSLLERHIQPKITKREFLQMISETETAPAKPKEKQKGKERKGPFEIDRKKPKPSPKAKNETNEAETAEPIVKPKTPKTKPKTPFSPKPGIKPAPKAGKNSVPTWLKWDNLGLNF